MFYLLLHLKSQDVLTLLNTLHAICLCDGNSVLDFQQIVEEHLKIQKVNQLCIYAVLVIICIFFSNRTYNCYHQCTDWYYPPLQLLIATIGQ